MTHPTLTAVDAQIFLSHGKYFQGGTSREPGEEPKGRPGGPGKGKRARGNPLNLGPAPFLVTVETGKAMFFRIFLGSLIYAFFHIFEAETFAYQTCKKQQKQMKRESKTVVLLTSYAYVNFSATRKRPARSLHPTNPVVS